MKKEIEVWVDPLITIHDTGSFPITKDPVIVHGFKVRHEDREMIKAKLIIEIPEKKIEITESQFDEAWKEMHKSPLSDYEFLKERLFGKEGEK
jgi:hypothetical protein